MKFDKPRRAVRLVARRLEKDGYAVLVDPEVTTIPFPLSGYLPDLLAMKGRDENWLVDVNFPGRAHRPDSVLLASAEARRHPGWGVLYCNVREDELLADASSATAIASLDDISRSLVNIDQLGVCEQTASFIVPTLWTVLLQLLKSIMNKDGEKVAGFSDSAFLNRAYSLGYLFHEQLQAMQQFLSIRNHIVHGLEYHVTAQDCQQMRNLASELMAQMTEVRQATVHSCAVCQRGPLV
jgi:hypothetical protein